MRIRSLIGAIALMVIIPLAGGSCDRFWGFDREGLSDEIKALIPDSILSIAESLGMPINKGTDPPIVEGNFLASPFILYASNRIGDVSGQIFSNYQVTFYDASETEDRLRLNYKNGPENGAGVEAYISGKGMDFTIFARLDAVYNGFPARLVHMISGTLSTEGIEDLYFSNMVVDNYGNPGQVWMQNGQCRVLYDSDGLSQKITQPKSSSQTGPQLTSGTVDPHNR